MRRTISRYYKLFPALAVVLCTTFSASAALIDLGNVTRDTESGLDWLDPSQSIGFSFDSIVAGAGGFAADGWRHASGAELCGIFGEMGLAPSPCPGSIPSFEVAEVSTHLTLFGITLDSRQFDQLSGIYDDGDSISETVGLAEIRIGFGPKPFRSGTMNVANNAVLSNRAEVGSSGHFLVRPVPELSSALLLSFGLLALTVVRRFRGIGPRTLLLRRSGGRLRSS